jgi:hypothetical protein
MMSFTADERKLLKMLVRQELDSFRKEGATVFIEDNPNFMALEETYEIFLEKLLKKL